MKKGKGKVDGAITVIPRWKLRTSETHERHLEFIKKFTHEIVLLGDSIFEHWLNDGHEAFKSFKLNNFKLLNAGVGGDCTQHVLWRYIKLFVIY